MSDIRLKQRFKNFESAFKILISDFDGRKISEFSELEQGGLVQHFEVVWELAWKVIKDYLENDGVKISIVSPRSVIKEAAHVFFEAANIDGDIFIEMLNTRNELSHIYDSQKFQKSLVKIQSDYVMQLENLYLFLHSQVAQDE